MNNQVFIDLDKEEKLPRLTAFQGIVNIKRKGRIIVRNSVLENIDTYSEEDLRYILTYLKRYISPIVTSQYIPNIATMKILRELAPEFKVRIKIEKAGGTPIIPISSEEFFKGEEVFQEILSGVQPEWSEMQKMKYLYNETGKVLSYDLNVLNYGQNSNFHEKTSRNIFTAISKNWGICASFAAMYDYLCYRSGLESTVLSEEDHDYVLITTSEGKDFVTDPTVDSIALKFGMRTRNFGVSREEFQESGHHLEQTEAAEYEIDSINPEEIQELDQVTGYLDDFGGTYTDELLARLANHLEGDTQFKKAESFLKRIKDIKSVGRPTVSDFEGVLNWILSQSRDQDFVKGIKLDTILWEDSKELPRKLVMEVTDQKTAQYYVFEDGLREWQQVDKIEPFETRKEKNIEEK